MMNSEEIKKLIKQQLNPISAKIDNMMKNYTELSQSIKFLSAKYDELIEQSKKSNEKIVDQSRDLTTIKQDIKVIDRRANEALDQADELGQYIRRDCLEISGVKANDERTSEEIVEAVGEVIGIHITKEDISIAHPLPSSQSKQAPKIIVKFNRRKIRNQFYSNRKKLARIKSKDLPGFENSTSNNVFIAESLTPKRKKLFGEINKFKKRHKWKFIWTYNGRIFIKENENGKQYVFDNDVDLQNFMDKFDPYDQFTR